MRQRTVAIPMAVAFLMTACGPIGAPTPRPRISASTAPSTSATASAEVSADALGTPSAAATAGLIWDASLLDILPADIDGIARIAEPGAFADLESDASLVSNVEAVAIAVFAGPGDLATVSVARLREGRFGDTFFRDWRDTYDAAACAPAGGVTGHSEAQLGGRATFITTCRGEVLAYHVHLPERNVLVSLFAAGPNRLGERLLSALAP